ncbi:MAG: AMP-binding protein, partial [Promethearchaeota archaeon]
LLTLDSFYEEKIREVVTSGKTNVKSVITTNITDMIKLNPIIKFLGKKLKKIPYAKEIKPISGIKLFQFKEIMDEYPNNTAPDVKIDPKTDLAFLQYTGGTTGQSKGAMLTHENEVANIKQVTHWWEVDATKGEDIFLSAFPFFHLAGLFMNLGAIAYAGCQLLIPNPRDTSHMIKLIEKWKPQIIVNVPTLYLMLIQDPKFRKLDLSSVRVYVSGAAPFPSESIKEFESIVGEHKLLEVYGMTEASPIVTMNPYLGKRKIGWVGVPVSNTEVKIVDVSDKTKEVPLGEAGEIAVKGPQVFKGYWNKPEETKNALKEGFFYTGDVGMMDEDGFIKIVDRTKDMIIVSGFKVFSKEVDDKMNKHPLIELASCVGVPDPERPGSELVKLFVKLNEGIQPTEEVKQDILNYARENLAKYKVPKIIEFVPNIPLTVIGKVDKKALRNL